MASVILRPVADVYSTHTKYPADSENVYTLVNEEVSDGESSYIGIVPSVANKLYTATSSFILEEKEISPDSQINGVSIYGVCSWFFFGTNTQHILYEVSFNGISCYGYTSSTFSYVWSLDNPMPFVSALQDYVHTYGKLPSIKLTVTTYFSTSKTSNTFYISQIYLRVNYDAETYIKRDGLWWKPLLTYKKINGAWEMVQNGDSMSQIRSRINKRGHHCVGITNAIPCTCTTTGLTAGVKCSICNEVLQEVEVVPASGHTPVATTATTPTCGKDGHSGGEVCSVCNAILSGEVIPATGLHTLTTVSGTAATCGKDGMTAGEKCSVCNYVSIAQEVIPATGKHTPADVAAVAPTCVSGYTAGVQCSVCDKWLSGHQEIPATDEHTPKPNGDGIAATTLDLGMTESIVCSVCGAVIVDHQAIPTIK